MLKHLLLASILLFCACAANTRVGRGQLFAAGDNRYDAYFKQIHDIQLYVASWGDERRNTRRALRDAMQLLPDASDSTISHSAQDRVHSLGGEPPKLVVNNQNAQVTLGAGEKSDPPFFKAVEETARAELDRVARLRGLELRLEELDKQGHALEDGVEEAFHDGDKQKDVKNELSDSFDVIRKTIVAAKRQARDGEDFVADLQRALSGDSTVQHGDTRPSDRPLPPATTVASAPVPPPSPTPTTPAPAPTTPATTASATAEPPAATSAPPPPPPPPPPTSTAKHKPKPAPHPPAGGPKPKPKPKPKPSGGDGEVFNP